MAGVGDVEREIGRGAEEPVGIGLGDKRLAGREGDPVEIDIPPLAEHTIDDDDRLRDGGRRGRLVVGLCLFDLRQMADDEPAQGCGPLWGCEADEMGPERRVGRHGHGKRPRLRLRLPERARPLRPRCRRPDWERAGHFYSDGRAPLRA